MLDKKLVAGSQMVEINSKYLWDNKVNCAKEYKMEFRTKECLFNKIKDEILKIHDYKVCEISYHELIGANKEFFEWIDKNIVK